MQMDLMGCRFGFLRILGGLGLLRGVLVRAGFFC